MRCLVSFLDFLAAGGRAIADLTLAELTDYLFAVQNGQEEDRSSNQTCPRTMLKALSWLQKVAQLEPLRPLLHNPVVMAFHSDSKPTDRREAMPLPLAVIAAWEAHVCNPSCSESLRLFLGGLLLATHSSLRFGDLQRIIPESLSLAQDSLRGSCWSTKTSTQGQPFAITVYGITGRNLESAWPIHWLQAVASCLSRSIQTFGENHVPDFILPAFSPAQLLVDPLYSAPLQYSHALASIRWAAQTPWLPSPCLTLNEASNITLHSLKVTFLAAALQLRLPEEDRRVQGHHKITVSAFIAGTIPTNPSGSNANWRRQSETAGALPAQSPEVDNTPWLSPASKSHPANPHYLHPSPSAYGHLPVHLPLRGPSANTRP